jgi:hypothetical protein
MARRLILAFTFVAKRPAAALGAMLGRANVWRVS